MSLMHLAQAAIVVSVVGITCAGVCVSTTFATRSWVIKLRDTCEVIGLVCVLLLAILFISYIVNPPRW